MPYRRSIFPSSSLISCICWRFTTNYQTITPIPQSWNTFNRAVRMSIKSNHPQVASINKLEILHACSRFTDPLNPVHHIPILLGLKNDFPFQSRRSNTFRNRCEPVRNRFIDRHFSFRNWNHFYVRRISRFYRPSVTECHFCHSY